MGVFLAGCLTGAILGYQNGVEAGRMSELQKQADDLDYELVDDLVSKTDV